MILISFPFLDFEGGAPMHKIERVRKTFYLGIDPGGKGGLAAIDNSDNVYALKKMPDTLEEILQWCRMFEGTRCYAMLEEVSGYIGVAHPGSSMFKFGRSYGALEMGLVAIGLEEGTTYRLTLPQRWQRGLGLRKKTKGESDASWKGYLKSEAAALFPQLKATLKTADALLIAKYCKQVYGGKE